MGASGLPNLRELAALGFGEYRATPLSDQDALQNIPAAGQSVTTIKLPKLNTSGAGQPYMLIGGLNFPSYPPELIWLGFGSSAPPVTQMARCTQNPEPVYRFLTPENPQLVIVMQFADWGSSYLVGGVAVTYDCLVGTIEQYRRLLELMHAGRAPASIIESALDTLADFVAPGGGDW